MRRFIFLLLMTLTYQLYSQRYEAGLFLGGSQYSGEFTERLIVLKETHFAYGGVFRYNFSRRFDIELSLNRCVISGSDANAVKHNELKTIRNLSFKSPITDLSITPQLNLLRFQSGHFKYKKTPYIFAGVSIFKFNPMADYNGKWVALQPLGTEGQNIGRFKSRKYHLTQVGIPFGAGWKQHIKKGVNICFEIRAYKTFTDYLDDVSTTYVSRDDLLLARGEISADLSNRTGEVGTLIPYTETDARGNSKTKDWFYMAGITITYSFLPKICKGF